MKKDNNLKIKITSLFLSTITVITMGGCSIKKEPIDEDIIINTTTSFSSSVETTENKIQDVTGNTTNITTDVSKQEVSQKHSNTTYDELLEMLDKNTSHFDQNIQKDLENLLEIMYSNKDAVNQVLPLFGYPAVEDILKDKFIKPLGELETIKIHHYEEDNYYDEICKYSTSCYVEEENAIHIFCDGDNQNALAQILAEEVFHSGQKYSKVNEDLGYSYYSLFGEGEANILSWSLVYGSISNLPAVFFYDDAEYMKTNVGYGLGNAGHSLCTKYNMYLTTLVGYDTIEEYKKTFNDKIIIDKLNKQGLDGEKLFTDMRDVIVSYQFGTEQQFVDTFVGIEKTFLNCMEKKVDKANTKKEVENMLEMYRYLNIQYGYDFIIYTDSDELDKTSTKLDKTNIENMLFEKCQQHGILSGFSKEKEKEIFKNLISPPRQREENVYPIGLLNSNIKYDSETNTVIVSNNDDCSYMHTLGKTVERLPEQGNSINEVNFEITVSKKSVK